MNALTLKKIMDMAYKLSALQFRMLYQLSLLDYNVPNPLFAKNHDQEITDDMNFQYINIINQRYLKKVEK